MGPGLGKAEVSPADRGAKPQSSLGNGEDPREGQEGAQRQSTIVPLARRLDKQTSGWQPRALSQN